MKINKCIRYFAVAILAVWLLGLPLRILATDTGIIKGRVTVGTEQQPLSRVEVSASNPHDWNDSLFEDCWATTDSLGEFAITHVPIGVARIFCHSRLPALPVNLVEIKGDSVSMVHISYAPHIDGGMYEYGYDVGVRTAQQEWDLKAATVYYTSGVTVVFKEFTYFDTLTGLPRILIRGCTSDAWDHGMEEGHNSELDKFIRKYGLPNYSYKQWLPELMNLKSYVERLERDTNIDTVRPYGPPSISLDSQTAISLDHTGLKIRRGHVIDEIPNLNTAAPQHEERIIAWGPPDSYFVVVRSADYILHPIGAIEYTAYDTRTGSVLRWEKYDPD